MAIKDRIAKMEASAQVAPQLGAAAWWNTLLASPKENEHRINAAFLLAFSEIIEKPSPRAWDGLKDKFERPVEDLTDSQLAFALAYCGLPKVGFVPPEPDHEVDFELTFNNEDGREWLCFLATHYFPTFQGAPMPFVPELAKQGPNRTLAEHRARLRGEFLIPLFKAIFPNLDPCRYGIFEDWLAKDGEVESLLKSAREHMKEHAKPLFSNETDFI